MKRINVKLQDRGYPIIFGRISSTLLAREIRRRLGARRVVILTQKRVARFFASALRKGLKRGGVGSDLIMMPDGERFKNLRTVGAIYDKLIKLGADRKTPLLLLGGGVVGDVGGFVAATYLRGIPYVQIPTTLVAQVDSSIGGKTAVDHKLGKNLIGTFYQPALVFTDVDCLSTLPPRLFREGMAEVIKYGILHAPLTRTLSPRGRGVDEMSSLSPLGRGVGVRGRLERIVSACCRIKSAIVSADERDLKGRRALLNFGHTLGHAIEQISAYKKFSHGEAVAIGMVAAARVSHRLGMCDAKTVERIENILKYYKLPVKVPSVNKAGLIAAVSRDKKVKNGKIGFVAVRRIGRATVIPLTPERLVNLLQLSMQDT